MMLVVVLGVEAALDPWHPALRLAGCAASGVAVYLGASLSLNREVTLDLLRNARGVARARGRLA